MKKITAQNAPEAIGPYSHAVRTGNLLITSGQIPVDPSTGLLVADLIEDQTDQVMANLKAILENEGLSLMNVVKTTVYLKDIAEFISKIKKTINSFVYSEDSQTIEAVIVSLLKQKERTLVTAESCTGGLISNRITNISGSSEIFKGSVISYSNQSKIKLLNVDKEVIDKFGAVSEQVASLMSKNALKLFSSDYALSVTGIAGPCGGTKDKPVGLVYIGLSYKLKTVVKKFQFGNDRIINKIKTSQASLNMLRRTILNDE